MVHDYVGYGRLYLYQPKPKIQFRKQNRLQQTENRNRKIKTPISEEKCIDVTLYHTPFVVLMDAAKKVSIKPYIIVQL